MASAHFVNDRVFSGLKLDEVSEEEKLLVWEGGLKICILCNLTFI